MTRDIRKEKAQDWGGGEIDERRPTGCTRGGAGAGGGVHARLACSGRKAEGHGGGYEGRCEWQYRGALRE